jgi:hypothetical protein
MQCSAICVHVLKLEQRTSAVTETFRTHASLLQRGMLQVGTFAENAGACSIDTGLHPECIEAMRASCLRYVRAETVAPVHMCRWSLRNVCQRRKRQSVSRTAGQAVLRIPAAARECWPGDIT